MTICATFSRTVRCDIVLSTQAADAVVVADTSAAAMFVASSAAVARGTIMVATIRRKVDAPERRAMML
jgi:hypothetical protein